MNDARCLCDFEFVWPEKMTAVRHVGCPCCAPGGRWYLEETVAKARFRETHQEPMGCVDSAATLKVVIAEHQKPEFSLTTDSIQMFYAMVDLINRSLIVFKEPQ